MIYTTYRHFLELSDKTEGLGLFLTERKLARVANKWDQGLTGRLTRRRARVAFPDVLGVC
jgi:hypothetical protein